MKNKIFIEKAVKIHNNRYDYSLVDYINCSTNITIICNKHGNFLQRPANHLRGAGCPICAKQDRINTNLKKYGTKYPIQSDSIKDIRTQNNIKKYGVSSPSSTLDVKEKVKQTCLSRYGVTNVLCLPSIRDNIKQILLNKYGVDNVFKHSDIQNKIRQHWFDTNGVEHVKQRDLSEIVNLLNDYDWLYDQYIVQNKSAIHIAFELNVSDLTIGNYLRKHEIDIKQYVNHSEKSIQWLESVMQSDNIHIQHAMNGGEYQIPGTRYKADGYCKETNTIYEFHGNYWHGNPDVYESNVINESTQCTMGELYQKTLLKEEKIKELGYNLIVMWELDWSGKSCRLS